MPASPIFPIIVTFLHDLFTAIWIGGLIILAAAVLPALRKTLGKRPELRAASDAIQKRLSFLVYISMAGLWITGLLLVQRSGAGGLFRFTSTYTTLLSLKHIAVLLMVVLALLRSAGRRISEAFARPGIQAPLLLANLLLGVITLGLSAATAILHALPGA
ncbi:MAG: hypothetical protein JXB35_17625 [Anaerolineae bacterium]|nr:hypothetical protein [Anaerolineae bacterium]